MPTTARTPRASNSATSWSASASRARSRSASASCRAFFELHIEQGPILEAEHKDIGVVTHGQGLWWLQVTLTGKEAHTGSTPMPMRRNAGLGIARIAEMVHHVAMEHQPAAVGAIGHCDFHPNSRNVIPGKVVFTIDIRSPDQTTLDQMKAKIETAAPHIARELGLGIEIELVGHFDPVTFDAHCVKAVRDAAEAARLFPSRHHLRRRPRRLLDQPRRADLDGHVPLRRRPVAQRGREDHAGMGEAGANVLFHAVVETAEIVP